MTNSCRLVLGKGPFNSGRAKCWGNMINIPTNVARTKNARPSAAFQVAAAGAMVICIIDRHSIVPFNAPT